MPPRGFRKAAASAVTKPSPNVQSETNKRKLDEDRQHLSPRRQSKRVKSAEHLQAKSSNLEDQTGGVAVSVKGQPEVEDVGENPPEVKREEIDGHLATPVKPTKKRKTKSELEAEAMPLRARTKGLRMHVGAHVSAAGGTISCFPSYAVITLKLIIVLVRCLQCCE